jgi:peptidoglycan hydrolase CwlO-like protein
MNDVDKVKILLEHIDQKVDTVLEVVSSQQRDIKVLKEDSAQTKDDVAYIKSDIAMIKNELKAQSQDITSHKR